MCDIGSEIFDKDPTIVLDPSFDLIVLVRWEIVGVRYDEALEYFAHIEWRRDDHVLTEIAQVMSVRSWKNHNRGRYRKKYKCWKSACKLRA